MALLLSPMPSTLSYWKVSADVFSLPKKNKIYIPPHLKSKLGMVVSLPL